MNPRSMRLRLTLVFLLILAPFLFISSHLVVASHRGTRADDVKRASMELLEKATITFRRSDWSTNLTKLFSSDRVKDLRIGALVVGGDGNVAWQSPNDAPSWPRPIHDTAPSIRAGSFQMILNLPDMKHTDDRNWHALVMLNLAALGAVAVGAWLLVGRTLHPIRALAYQAAVASVDDAGIRLTPPSQDVEMFELVATLNGLLSRIEESSAEKGRFYAAASHELRTPLQALLGHLEVALGQPRSEEEYQSTLQEAQVQTQRLVSLVEGILLLHQLQGSTRPDRETVCLSEIVELQLAMLAPLVEVRGLQLQVQLEPVTVATIPTHAQVLVRNLLENAAKYAREGGVLSVTLSAAKLRISNDLADGAAMEVERLFEPFYRQDASRSAKSGGNGLGLAICRAVARANGWEIGLRLEGERVVAGVGF